MANLTAATSLRQVSSGPVAEWQAELYAGQKFYSGGMVCRRTADGYAVKAGTAGTGRVLGIAKADTATCVVSGDTNVNLLTGQFIRPCHASHTPTVLDIGKAVYASDDSTISNLPSDGPIAGILTGFEDGSGDAIFYIEPADANAIGLGSKEILLLNPGTLAAGTPMAAFADNAASQPGVTLVDSKGAGIRWNNNATQVAVWTGFVLPRDIDTSYPATLLFKAAKTGATSGDATKFTVTAFNNAVGALDDADTDFGGDTSAMTGAATAKTVQEVSLTLAATDLGSPGDHVSMSFKPKDGTLGTDDVVLFGIELQYRKKS
jgi:hypothetical protein